MNTYIKKKEIKKVTIAGIIINICISALKIGAGLIGNSQSVIADGVHSISDTSSDIVILFGIKYWTAPPDSKHPYGHQKIESLVTAVIGFMLLAAAFGIGYNAVASFRDPHLKPLKWFVIIGPVLSIVSKELLYRWTYRVGIKTNSPSVKANAWHHRSDAFSSIPVLAAVLASSINPKLLFLDHLAAIIVTAFILKIAATIIFNSINELIDTGISRRELEEIYTVINKIENVEGVHAVRTRMIASSIYIDLHLEVNGELSVAEGHSVSEKVKQILIETNPGIIDVMVHIEPK